MKRTPLFLLSRCFRSAASFFLLLPLPLAAAQRYWADPLGGPFSLTSNWAASDGGATGVSVPVAADSVYFTLSNTYTVGFTVAVSTNALSMANGNVTFDLDGNVYTLPYISVGTVSGQTARLTVKDGTMPVTGIGVYIGDNVGSTGFLTVATGGRLGTPASPASLTVGSNGNGTLTVNDNGRISGGVLSVGSSAAVSGTMTVTGQNAAADFNDIVSVGFNGTGTVSVLNGGSLNSTGELWVGTNPGADGTATVSGAGSSWTPAAATLIGRMGDGILTVSSGGFFSAPSISVGHLTTGVGTLTVTGADSWCRVLTSPLVAGASAHGTVNVTSGGFLDCRSGTNVAFGAGSTGKITVSGAGSLLQTVGTMNVGSSGAGELMVSAGGRATAQALFLATVSTGTGAATVTGAGSKLTVTGNASVGEAGTATMEVLSGGELRTTGNLTVQDPAGTTFGTLKIDGGAVYAEMDLNCPGTLVFPDGLVQVKRHFTHNDIAGVLAIDGSDTEDLPVLELIGTGNATNITDLHTGVSRRGELRLREGRVVSIPGNATAAYNPGSAGHILVASGAQFLVPAGLLAIGGTSTATPAAGGTGTLDIEGGTVDVSALRNYVSGTINLSSGTLAVDAVTIMDGAFHWTGGTLRFDAATFLTITNAPKLFGPVPALHAGQILASGAGIPVTLQTPLVVDGGGINASSFINQSRLELRSGSIGALQNDGLLLGDGLVAGAVTNTAAGRIRVDEGDTLTFSGAFAPNAGQLTLQGGTLEFSGAITNLPGAFISGRGALFTGSLTNNGQMAFSGGTMDVFGDVTLNAGSRVATSGAGSVTTFWDDVIHNGTEIFTGAGCSTVFFGALSGAGSFTGTGAVYFIGDLRPGNSPAVVTCAPEAVLSPSSGVRLEIGGLAPGTQHDKLVFTSAASPQVTWSGTLTVSLVNGFTPAAGQSFDILDFDPARDSGAFINVVLPALPGGLAWDTAELYSTGTLRVVTSTGLTFSQWAATVLGNPAATPGGDHDGDGFDNGTEFALGLYPPQPNTILPGGGFHNYPDGQRLRMLFSRPLDRSGLTLRIQAASDLTGWTDLAVSANSAAFTGPGFVSENRSHPLNEPGLVEVRDILTTGNAPRRQIRLLITVSP